MRITFKKTLFFILLLTALLVTFGLGRAYISKAQAQTTVHKTFIAGTYKLVTSFSATGEVDTGTLVATLNQDGKSGSVSVAIKGLTGVGDWRDVGGTIIYAFHEVSGPVTISVSHVITGIQWPVFTSKGFGQVFNTSNALIQYVETTSTLTYENSSTTLAQKTTLA